MPFRSATSVVRLLCGSWIVSALRRIGSAIVTAATRLNGLTQEQIYVQTLNTPGTELFCDEIGTTDLTKIPWRLTFVRDSPC